MRLSEAIRLGAMLGPQALGWFHDDVGGTCALGAAKAAVGSATIAGFEPVLRFSPVTCPACQQCFTTTEQVHALGAMIVHLNDGHRWTREQIAELVASFEPADASPLSADAVAGAELVTLEPTIRA